MTLLPENSDRLALENRIANYRQTRQWSVGQVRAWCDALIRDAEAQLSAMNDNGPDERSWSPATGPTRTTVA